MIDFLKAVCIDSVAAHWLRRDICTTAVVDTKTGLIIGGKYTGQFRDFKITVCESNRIEIAGSFHKYIGGGYNYTDLTIEEFRKSVNSFCKMFVLDPARMQLTNLEVGVNVIVPFAIRGFLRSIVGLSTGDQFRVQRAWGRECRLFEYRYKFYNKSAQTKLAPPQMLRYELHYDKSRKFMPVKTLQDLFEIENWVLLAERAKWHFKHIIFRDSYLIPENQKPLFKFWKEYGQRIDNREHWHELTPIKRFRSIRRMKQLEQYGRMQWGIIVFELIAYKFDQLTEVKRFHRLITG